MAGLWEYSCLSMPMIERAGRYPHAEKNFAVRYCAQTTAIHLYEYACTMRLGRWAVQIAAGDLTLSPAGVATCYHLPRPGYHLCVHFTLGDKAGHVVGVPLHVSCGRKRLKFRRKLESVIDLFQRGGIGRIRASLLLQELLLDLSMLPQKESDSSDKIHTAARIISDNFFQAEFSIAELAERLEISPNYFTRKFSERYGVPPKQYLTRYRLEHAMFLLESSSLTVKQIASRCGMPDPQFFNKMFRRHTGGSPSAFRQGR